MITEHCYGALCFVPLDANGSKFFGFSEFLAALALMVLAWTIADVRYRFRLRTAPIPLEILTFSVISAVGVLTLLTDWWRADHWWVPNGHLITPAGWQALLGGLFLFTFLLWAWFAFMRPAVFGRLNGRRFARQLYRAILKGSSSELPEIADELARSARALVAHSWQSRELKSYQEKRTPGKETAREKRMRVRRYAYDSLLLIADRKFCRHVVESSPITALALFEEMALQKKFDVPLDTFAKNITSEAISNKDSFAYHEVEGYYTGFVGYYKPLTTALYGNHALVSALDQVFDVDYREKQRWTADQWEAFCRLVLVTFKSYVESGARNHSFVLHRAFSDIERSLHDLYKLNDASSDWWTHESVRQLEAVVMFALGAVQILDARTDVLSTKLRRKKDDHQRDVFDLIAGLMFEIVFQASTVKAPQELCWSLQYNRVWSRLFESTSLHGPASKIVKHKLRRLIYDEIAWMSELPNFKGSRILGIVLNVVGFRDIALNFEKPATALRKAVLAWTKKNFARMADESPRVAADCLVAGMAYDAAHSQLVKTGMLFLDEPRSRTILALDPLPAKETPPTESSNDGSAEIPAIPPESI